MKKVIGIFMIMVLVFLAVTMNVSLAETVVSGYYGSEVQTMVEEWMRSQKVDQKYFDNTVDEFGYFYGYGALPAREFKKEFGVEWNPESMYDALSKEFRDLELEFKTIGFYEGYNVYRMYAKSTDSIGCYSYYGVLYPFFEGEMIIMVYADEP